jgi:hypothetical protein
MMQYLLTLSIDNIVRGPQLNHGPGQRAQSAPQQYLAASPSRPHEVLPSFFSLLP